ncbi:MAG: SDR family oxidoreductase, partial [Gammaproteobacteria bacterium]
MITGANRGLGFEMTRQYAARSGVFIFACCRAPAKAVALQELANAKGNIEVLPLNVADHDSIEALGVRLGERPIDILINNAGIFGKSDPATTGFDDQQFGKSDFAQDWIMPYRVNVIGPMKMVETLIDNVAASTHKKIVIVTSVVGSVALAQGHMFGYAASKSAANMTAKNLAVALQRRNVVVNPVHPGYAQTDMGGPAAHVEVPTAIEGVIKQIDAMSLEHTGEFLSFD